MSKKADLLDREDVQRAIETDAVGSLPAATKVALRTRGLVQDARVPSPYRHAKPFTRWDLTEEGEALRDQLRKESRAKLYAERAAKGIVEVPRWAVEVLAGKHDRWWGTSEETVEVRETIREALATSEGAEPT